MINRTQPRHVKSFLNTSRIRRRRRIQRNIRIGLFVTFIISCIVGFVYISNTPRFQLKETSVKGLNKLNDTDIKKFTETEISKNSNFFGLIPASSTFYISEEKLEKAILSQYPRIESVKVSNSFAGSLNIEIVERLGMAKWCTSNEEDKKSPKPILEDEKNINSTSSPEIDNTSNIDEDNQSEIDNPEIADEVVSNPGVKICYEFDKDGYIFDEIILDKGMNISNEGEDILNKDATQSTEFRGLINGDPIGQRFLDEGKFNNLLKVVQFVNSINLKDEYVICETSELCTIKVMYNGEIYIDISSNIDVLIERLKAIFENEVLKDQDFKYVDARYGNKVFYKTK